MNAEPEAEGEELLQDETQDQESSDMNPVSAEETGLADISEEFIDEPYEWDSDSSSQDTLEEDEEEDQTDIVSEAGFSHVNQKTVTRSGRTVTAAKHYMFDTGWFHL